MRRYLFILVLINCYSVNIILAQDNGSEITSTLEKLFIRLRENHPTGKKNEISDSIRLIIDSYSSSDTIFNHRFSNIRNLGQITSPDSLVKILTWNLILEEGDNKYFCNFIRRSDQNGRNKVYRLTGNYNQNSVRSDTTYSSSDWYGSLYYDLRPFIYSGTTKYILLGIDYGNPFITRKVIDVLSFEGPDGVIFGMKCFSEEMTLKSRIVFEYSSSALMSLKFEADDLIVFDHLSPFSPELKGNRQFYGPDFSFDSFKLEKGYWRFIGDIDIKNK